MGGRLGCCQTTEPGEGELGPLVVDSFASTVQPPGKNHEEEEEEETAVTPGVSWFVAQRDTPFTNVLESGSVAVVRANYFKECLEQGIPLQDREHIPSEAFIDGSEVVDLWVEFGYAFLMVVSYPWLSREHPDPQCFHLPRLVQALETFKQYHNVQSWVGEKRSRAVELGGGVILDYCSLWQGSRTAEEERLFKEGLSLIHIPYGHRDVTALKLTSTPPDEARLYDDRGWTLFESTIIDSKEPSPRHNSGERNVLACNEAFEPECNIRASVLKEMGTTTRRPPLTPMRFREELEVRRQRAEAKGEQLFRKSTDLPIILDGYNASFTELRRSTKLDYTNSAWGAREVRDLALALKSFGALEEFFLRGNHLDSEAAAALAGALPFCRALRALSLSSNRLGVCAEGAIALVNALPDCPLLEVVDLSYNGLGAEAAEALTAALPQCSSLNTLWLGRNSLGANAEASSALVAALADCEALEELYLFNNSLGAEAAAAFVEALPRCRVLRTLRLGDNRLGVEAEASVALANALANCAAMEELDLSRNSIGKEAAKALAGALPRCHALHTLYLGGNRLGTSGEAVHSAWRAAGKEDQCLFF